MITTLLLVLMVLASACAGTPTGPRSLGRSIVFAADEELTGFNYSTSKDSSETARNVAENIFYFAVKASPDFQLEFPGLQGPPTIVSTDPQVVEWVIRREAVWSDGTPVTSEDLRYFHSQAVDPDNDVASHEGYNQITKLVVVDDKTIRATFEPHYADYQSLWGNVPQAAFMKAQPGGWNSGLDRQPGPSAGPFKLQRWERGQSLTLVANPRWWGDQKPGIDAIVFRFLSDSTAQVQALANGEVDMITPPPDPDLIARVDALPGIRRQLSRGPAWVQLTFNLADPILAEPRVRRAIAHAVDRHAVVSAVLKPLVADASPLDNFVYVSNQDEYRAHGPQYQRADPEAARRLLAEAGWAMGPDGVRQRDGMPLVLRLAAASDGPLEPVQELIASQLRAVGIDARIDNCLFSCLVADRLEPGDFDVALFTWFGGVFPLSGIREIFSTGEELNYGQFTSPRFDELTKQALATLDAVEARELANAADVVLWDELPGLPLYQRPTFLAVSDRFSGVMDNGTDNGVFWNSETWRVKPEGS